MRNPWFRDSFCMNLTDLLALKPEELAVAILERRRLLAKALPAGVQHLNLASSRFGPKGGRDVGNAFLDAL